MKLPIFTFSTGEKNELGSPIMEFMADHLVSTSKKLSNQERFEAFLQRYEYYFLYRYVDMGRKDAEQATAFIGRLVKRIIRLLDTYEELNTTLNMARFQQTIATMRNRLDQRRSSSVNNWRNKLKRRRLQISHF